MRKLPQFENLYHRGIPGTGRHAMDLVSLEEKCAGNCSATAIRGAFSRSTTYQRMGNIVNDASSATENVVSDAAPLATEVVVEGFEDEEV